MAAALWRTGTGSPLNVGPGITNFMLIGAGAGMSVHATETIRQLTVRSPGVASRTFLRVTANDRAASTLKSRVDGADGGQLISIPANTTGTFFDLSGSDTLVSESRICFQLDTGGGGSTFAMTGASLSFAATTNTVTRAIFSGFFNNNNFTIVGSGSGGNETLMQSRIPFACTAKHAGILITSNTRDVAGTLTLRKNAANTAVVVSIPALTTGFFENTTDSVAVALDDLLNWNANHGSGTGIISPDHYELDLESTQSQWALCGGATSIVSAGQTKYSHLGGDIGGNDTEANGTAQANLACTLDRITANISSNAVTVASTMTLRINGVDSALSVSIPASTTGQFQNTTDSVSIDPSDELTTKTVAGATGTSFTIRNIWYRSTTISGSVEPDAVFALSRRLMHHYRRDVFRSRLV